MLKAGGKRLANKHLRDVDGSVRNDASAMHIAAQGKCVLTTQALLEVDGEKLLMHCTDEGSCLHAAVAYGSMPVLQTIMRAVNLTYCSCAMAVAGPKWEVAALDGRGRGVVARRSIAGGEEVLRDGETRALWHVCMGALQQHLLPGMHTPTDGCTLMLPAVRVPAQLRWHQWFSKNGLRASATSASG